MNLHDSTLKSVSFDWVTGSLTLALVTAQGSVAIEAHEVSSVTLPREQPWGPSDSIYSVEVTDSMLTFAMQSGDAIVVQANRFALP